MAFAGSKSDGTVIGNDFRIFDVMAIVAGSRTDERNV